MEEDKLALIKQYAQTAIEVPSDDVFADLAKGSDYLCRLQLQGKASALFGAGKIERFHYAYIITKEKFLDLGKSVNILPICWRPLALDMNTPIPIQFFDVKSAGFKETAARADAGGDSKCTYGPDFLVWIPEIEKFASLHLGSKTARIDAPDLMKIMKANGASTLTSRTIIKPTFTWDAITFNQCSSPIEYPDPEKAKDQIEKFFLQTKVTSPEKVEPATAGRTR